MQLLDLLDRFVDLLHQVVGPAGVRLLAEFLLLLDELGQVLPGLLELLLALLVEVVGFLLDLLFLLLDLVQLLKRLLDRLDLLLGLLGIEAVLQQHEQRLKGLGDLFARFDRLLDAARVEVFDHRADVDADAVLAKLLEAVLQLLRVVLLVLLAELVDQLRHLGVELLEIGLHPELALLDRLLGVALVLRQQDRAKHDREGRRKEWTHTSSPTCRRRSS